MASEGGFFRKWIEARLGTKRNVLLAIVGPTGSGKSYAGMKIGELFDRNEDFDISHVVFSVDEFYDAISRLKNNCFIVFDEAGLGFAHREYMSAINKMLAMVFQTFRYKYINVIFTLPKLGFMDYVGRSLLHGVLRMTDRGKAIVYKVQPNLLGSEIYYPREGSVEIGLPSKELIEAYEKKKTEFLEMKYKEFKAESRVMQTPYRYMSINELAKIIMDNRDTFMIDGKIDATLIAGMLEIGLPKAYAVKKFIEKCLINDIKILTKK